MKQKIRKTRVQKSSCISVGKYLLYVSFFIRRKNFFSFSKLGWLSLKELKIKTFWK